jgi:hypothetical protein
MIKLTELFIKSYPPIKDQTYQFQPGFNLLFGSNEQGKSLTIDAMVKLLLGKASKNFANIDRVPEQPQDYGSYLQLNLSDQQVKRQTKQQANIKLQGDQHLPDLLNISAQDCQNIFVIRNSQLSIGRDLAQEQQFYINLTDRLTGLQTEQIKNLIAIIRDQAQLTAKTNRFQSTQDNQELGDRLQAAQQLLSETSLLSKMLRAATTSPTPDTTKNKNGDMADKVKQINKQVKIKWPQLLEAKLKLEAELSQVEQTIEDLDQARKKHNYQLLKHNWDQLQAVHTKLKPLVETGIEQKALDQWRQWQQEVTQWQQRQQRLEADLEKLKNKQEQVRQEQVQAQQELEQLKQKQLLIKEQAQPQLNQLKQLQQTIAGQKQLRSTWMWFGAGSGLSLIVASLGFALNQHWLLAVIAGLSLILSLASAIKLYLFQQQQAQFNQQLQAVQLDLAQHDYQGETVTELLQQVQSLAEHYQQQATAVKVKETELNQTQGRLDQLQADMTELQQKISNRQQKIQELRNELQLDSISALQNKLEKKRQLTEEQSKYSAVLASKLGQGKSQKRQRGFGQLRRKAGSKLSAHGKRTDDKQIESRLTHWKKQLQQMAANIDELDKFNQSQDRVKSADFSEEKLQQAKQQKKNLQQKLKELQQKLSLLQEKLDEIKDQVNSCLLPETPLQIQGLADLRFAQERLEAFVNQHQRAKDQALATIDILQQIAQEDKQKVADLFGRSNFNHSKQVQKSRQAPDSKQSKHAKPSSGLISSYFQSFTQQRYQQVLFNQQQERIEVVRPDGTRLTPDKLSAGTYDQLYFAIRLGLAHKLLAQGESAIEQSRELKRGGSKGEQHATPQQTGFFILDDPFIKADQQRLRTQLKMLLNLAQQGWQILYFSAKQEVRQALQTVSGDGKLPWHEIAISRT